MVVALETFCNAATDVRSILANVAPLVEVEVYDNVVTSENVNPSIEYCNVPLGGPVLDLL